MPILTSEEAVIIAASVFPIPVGQELESRRRGTLFTTHNSQELSNTVNTAVLVLIHPKKGIVGKSRGPAQSFKFSIPIDVEGNRISRVSKVEAIDLEIDNEETSLLLGNSAQNELLGGSNQQQERQNVLWAPMSPRGYGESGELLLTRLGYRGPLFERHPVLTHGLALVSVRSLSTSPSKSSHAPMFIACRIGATFVM